MLIAALKNYRRRTRWRAEIDNLRREFASLAKDPSAYHAASLPIRRLLIVPSDPWTLVGAKGDEAMMESAAGELRKRNPDLQVGVVVATDAAADAARGLGFMPVNAWSCGTDEAMANLEAFGADGMVLLGADIMDGYYNPVSTAHMLLLADAAVQRGVRAAILGFSFNQQPNPLVRPVFNGLDRGLTVNVRDRISLRRFQAFSRTPAMLVADMAFMLEPDTTSSHLAPIGRWIAERHSAGDRVLGFNTHPMLIRHATPAQVKTLVDSAVEALKRVTAQRAVSLLLIAHDYRDKESDAVCLEPIHDQLAAALGNRILYPRERYSAAELKAMAGMTDAVVTGRMHLAIATLGMARPVGGLTYQDKFQGLLAHFDYPERFLLSPAEAVVPDKLASMMLDLLDQQVALQTRVADKLPEVRVGSARNLERLL